MATVDDCKKIKDKMYKEDLLKIGKGKPTGVTWCPKCNKRTDVYINKSAYQCECGEIIKTSPYAVVFI